MARRKKRRCWGRGRPEPPDSDLDQLQGLRPRHIWLKTLAKGRWDPSPQSGVQAGAQLVQLTPVPTVADWKAPGRWHPPLAARQSPEEGALPHSMIPSGRGPSRARGPEAPQLSVCPHTRGQARRKGPHLTSPRAWHRAGTQKHG